tara:strand:- start:1026 stop:1211 length:186 start_codon:yes stop_codon:yes gene_type:complete
MSKQIKYYHESSLFRSPNPSDLPNPDTLFRKIIPNRKKDAKLNVRYDKKASEHLKKLLGIK